jgi:hypothetical protein
MACSEKYILNSELQEMKLGEGEGTVLYDPETENTHVLDDVAQDIIEMFKNPSTIDEAVAKLAVIYDEKEEIISKDVQDFVANAVDNKILVLS